MVSKRTPPLIPRKGRSGVGFSFIVFCGCWLAAATASPYAAASPSQLIPRLGPQVGQSCNDPLKLAIDASVGPVVCTRSGQWVPSEMPSLVRTLGTPCSSYDPVAKTPDDYLIACQSGLWTLYSP